MKPILSLLLILTAIVTKAQVQINCCGIKQNIPVFKADTTFNTGDAILVAKRILKPIKQSDAPIEIRFIMPGTDMDSEVWVIKCIGGNIVVSKYNTVVRVIGAKMMGDEKTYYKDYKDVGPEKPEYKLTNLVKITDLSAKFKTYNWGSFFKQLADDHFFDMPSGKAFVDSLKSTYPGNYYSTAFDMVGNVIEIKVNDKYRILNIEPYGLPNGAPDISLAKFEMAFTALFESVITYGNK